MATPNAIEVLRDTAKENEKDTSTEEHLENAKHATVRGSKRGCVERASTT
jgi:hypothetical protein